MVRGIPTPKRRWNLSSPMLFLLIAARLSSSSFRASAQYVSDQGGTRRIKRFSTFEERDQKSTSRELTINAYDDFCLFGPPSPFYYIWSSGLNVVSWCAKDGHGTRLIPDGTLQGVTFVKTKDYVQISGTGDFTKINIAPGDVGGQFDSKANTPDGATVKSNGQAAGSWVKTLISANTFCLRACTGDPKYCPSQYDQMGCWFFTGNAVGGEGTWQNCESDSGDPPGFINGQSFTQGNQPIPEPSAPDLRNCQQGKAIANGQSPPPLYEWDGQGEEVASPIGSGKPNGNTNGSKDVSGGNDQNNSPSTAWVPVETCVPCQQPLVAATSSSTNAATTEQVGVTQMSGQVAALAKTPSPATKAATANDQLDRRQDSDQTVTKDGKCCHTTWTPSVIAGTTPTTKNAGTTAAGGSKTSGTLSGVITSGTLQTGGGVVPSGQTGTFRPSGSRASGVTGGNGTGNGTNGTGMGHRLEIVGVNGMRGVMLALTMTLLAMGIGAGFLSI